jgi:hypothetical protein
VGYSRGMWWSFLPALASDEAEIQAALERCEGAVHPLPALTAQQRIDLAAGKVVRILRHGDPEQPSTAVGLALLSSSRDALWIAAQDPHTQVDPALTEFVMRTIESDHALWYGYLDLPWPIKDRQWVVESRNTHTLAARSDDGCWEHTWQLVPDGLEEARPLIGEGRARGVTLEHLEEAIFTPVNHGSWHMAPVSGGKVLVAYQATSVVGGAIPDSLVVQLTMSRLESVLRDLETRANEWARTHYTASHSSVLGGGGKPIPPLR